MTNPKLEVLTLQNSQLIFIDHQPQMAFGVQSIDRQTLKNNVVALAKAAKAFHIPTTIPTVETQSLAVPRREICSSPDLRPCGHERAGRDCGLQPPSHGCALQLQ